MHLLDGITKERLIVQRLLNLFGEHSMIMLIRPRKVGKTTALLQLASKLNKNSVYIDCGDVEDQGLLSKIKMGISAGSEEYNDSYIFIDEIRELKCPANTVIDFANKMGRNPSIRVIITGSETALTDLLARGKGGGGRSKYIYMPMLTYIEYDTTVELLIIDNAELLNYINRFDHINQFLVVSRCINFRRTSNYFGTFITDENNITRIKYRTSV